MKHGVLLGSWTATLVLSLAWVACLASSGRDGEWILVFDASNYVVSRGLGGVYMTESARGGDHDYSIDYLGHNSVGRPLIS